MAHFANLPTLSVLLLCWRFTWNVSDDPHLRKLSRNNTRSSTTSSNMNTKKRGEEEMAKPTENSNMEIEKLLKRRKELHQHLEEARKRNLELEARNAITDLRLILLLAQTMVLERFHPELKRTMSLRPEQAYHNVLT